MSARKPRGLTEEDRILWDQVAATVKRRHRRVSEPGAGRVVASPVTVPTAPAKRGRTVLRPLAPPEPAIALINAPAAAKSALDGKRAQRLRKGELAIEARIDLHGMTLDIAHAALGGFLVQARTRGHRCVLVITGKGSGGKEGAIRQSVPRWLGEAPFAAMIADRAPAQPRHGGAGALYVYLRRKRT